jgi:tryptophan synthase beta chain
MVDGKDTEIIGVEPKACPTLTRGLYRYDFGDTAGTTPLILMHTLGHDFIPPPLHAGGLRYHGVAPSVSHLHRLGLIQARAHHQTECFDAALSFARAEGHLVAPETSHAVKEAFDEAMRCKESGNAKVIAFNASGHGHFDMGSYEKYFAGDLTDYEYPEERVQEALARLPEVP